jgi:hypothetical protein
MNQVLWWVFSVVIAGIMVNLASDYLRPQLDKLWARYSESRRKASEEREKFVSSEIQKLLSSEFAVVDLKLDILFSNVRAILVAAVFIFIAQILFNFPGLDYLRSAYSLLVSIPAIGVYLIATMFLINYISRARAARKLLKEYYRRKAESTGAPDSSFDVYA